MKKILTLLLTLIFAVGLISPATITTAYASNGVVMTVDDKEFTDFGEGWLYACSQNVPIKVVLYKDWIAPDRYFNYVHEPVNGVVAYVSATDKGRLYIDGDADFTIDLNGHIIDRGLTEATEYGQVFLLNRGGKLTITDSSEQGTGKITGGYTDGDGGAFYIDNGTLTINGGEISGNKAENGGAIYATNAADSFVYINGGKICNNTASNEGGAIFMYNGYLYVDGGEISGNSAQNGGGIYWESRDIFCLTGGQITGNKATDGGGVYATDWGDIYIGGNIVVNNNTNLSGSEKSNFYLEESDVYLNNAANQEDEVPNKPLTAGAYIGIYSGDENFCVSDSDSRFTEKSVKYLHSDRSSMTICSQYITGNSKHLYRIYYNNNSNVNLPYIKNVQKVNDYVISASCNSNSRTVILMADIKHREKGNFNNIALSELVRFTFNDDNTELWRFNEFRNFTIDQEYMVIGSGGTYVFYTVMFEWVCLGHEDKDGNCACDYCGEYTLTEFTITDYNAETREATVFVTKPGKYSLIFADYEDTRLANVDIVEYDFKEGLNVVPQEITNFTLTSGDKVMLWYDMVDLVPVCDALTLN